jgi:iron complex outermembrane receptor protein
MTQTNTAVVSGVSRVALGIALVLAAGTAPAQTAPVPTTPQGAPVPPPVQASGEQPIAPEQDATGSEDAEIVVTGIRASLANALSAKRDSAQVLDAISAEDIGKFPDKNVGEALQRVTGVQITRAGGEGSGVSIRGADPALNRVEINGQTALSTGAGVATRAVEFRDIPAEFVSRLEVVKSATADMTEGGLGGTVRIITRRPFDAKDGFLSGSAQAIYGDLADRIDPKFALWRPALMKNAAFGTIRRAPPAGARSSVTRRCHPAPDA